MFRFIKLLISRARFLSRFIFFIYFLSAICVNSEPQPCAVLRSNESPYQNHSLVLKDGSIFGNIAEEYLTADNSWNVSSVWTASPSCTLKACDDVYLNGICTTFSDGAVSPSGIWLSARCTCSKECTCPSDITKHLVCARAYLQPEGCNACDAPYTELIPDSDSDSEFLPAWSNKVSSFLVRSGCTITVYDEEDHEGNSEIITGPQMQNWSGTVGSYECKCNEDAYLQTSVTPAHIHPTAPQRVQIPDSLDDVVEKLGDNNFNHPGLLAALSSVTHGRSSKNVYLLLIGSSGAGKSSAINILLRNPNVTIAGDLKSTTSEILEFRIPVPVPDLGVENSELRIIDTPGLADTRGLKNDALFLATLDDYLKNHEELKSRIPNLVLIFHPFDDNRFHGEGAKFVRMIRGLDSLRTSITDENYSNVLFVFSHLCSAGKQLQQNPIPRLMKFKEVVELYSFFPKPIMTAVIENKGGENELLMRNGNFELPNKEYYPQNLLDKFDAITEAGQDKMGNAVLNSNVIRNQSSTVDFNITTTIYPLVNANNHKVPKYLNILTSAAFHVNNSEVSNLLAEAYVSMGASIKARFPEALENLQRYLNLKNIKSKADVPQTSKAILELFSGIEQNEAVSFLQESGLNMKPPVFPINSVIGSSFDILKNSILSVSPFKLDSRRSSSIGFMLPNVIRCTKIATLAKPVNMLQVFQSKQVYFQHVSRAMLGEKLSSVANSTELFSALTNKLKDGYFVKDVTCSGTSNMHCFSVTRLYKTFQFDLEAPGSLVQLQPDFLRRAQNIAAFNESSHDSIDEWTTFFNDFGTHVVTSAEGGGRIDIHFTLSKDVPVETAVEKVLKSLVYAEDPFGSVTSYREKSKTVFANSGSIKHTLTFRGGNQAYHVADISKLSLAEAVDMMKNWKRSLQFYPAVFSKEILPLGQVIGPYFPSTQQAQVSEKIETALARLLTSTLKYVAPTPDPKILEELERQRKENEERLRQLELEKKRKEEEAERQRLAAIEAQQKREREERERAEQRRREEEAAAAERRRQEEERQRILREEAEKRRREQLEAERRHQEYLRKIAEEERRRREHLEWLRREQQRQWEEANRRRRSSCLKKGTKILLADFTEKPVEQLKIGDVLLDKDLKPTSVLGISYEFLLTQKFYGFDNKTFFFTDTHIFAGARNDDTQLLQFYTTSTASLFAQNPLLQYLNVQEFQDSPGEKTRLLHFSRKNNGSFKNPVQNEITVFQEHSIYPEDTPIYFIQVDSPSGTYFAEGYVCRHEIPPLEYWPNTMSTLFSLFGTTSFEAVGKMPYTIDTIHLIDRISDRVQKAVLNDLDREFLTIYDKFKNIKLNENCTKLSFESFDTGDVIGRIFGNPTMAALGMEIYGGSGSIISKYLDSAYIHLTDCQVQHIQMVLADSIKREIDSALR